MTQASKTALWAISAFSRSTDEIHSPPLLIKSFVQSTILMVPSSSTVTLSPVYSQPSLNISSVLLTVHSSLSGTSLRHNEKTLTTFLYIQQIPTFPC